MATLRPITGASSDAAYGSMDETEAQASSMCGEEEEEDACCAACSVPANFVAEIYARRAQLLHLYLLAVVVLVSLIALYARFYEKWSLLWSVYFASYVSLGVGYGDLRIHRSALSWLSLSLIELAAVLIVGTVLSVAVSALFLTDKEEDWVTVQGANLRLKKCFSCLCFFMPIVIAAVALAEDWSVAKALYWFVDTATTVGCGYATPQSKFGKLVCVFALLLVSPIFLTIFSTLVLYPRALIRNASKQHVLDAYNSASHPQKPLVSKDEFALRFLMQARLLEESDLHDAYALYDKIYPEGQ